MSTMSLALIIMVVLIIAIFIGAVIYIMIKRNQYAKEAKGHIKLVILPEAGMPKSIIAEIGSSGHEVAAPEGHLLPRYYFNRENVYHTLYPENPIFGLGMLQVQIDTVYYYKDNPEPITSQAFSSPKVATASMIFASIDAAFALVVHELDAELQKTKKQLLEALSSKLSKPIVYGLLVVLLIAVIACIILVVMQNSQLKEVARQLGVK